ncbi:MAG: hypothetical protein ACLQBD_28625 [Syntrophobacteraceae bacterium]
MTEADWKRVSVSLSENADNLLRTVARRKGDLSEGLRTAILNTNWDEVELAKRRKTYQKFLRTSFAISVPIYEKIKECARNSGVEVSMLIDAIIITYYSRPHDNP